MTYSSTIGNQMTGKAYYITTLGDWQRHAPRFANSHFIVLDSPANDGVIPNPAAVFADGGEGSAVALLSDKSGTPQQIPRPRPGAGRPRNDNAAVATADAEVRILVLIEADEGVHLSLEDEPAFEALPHPLAQKPISDAAQSALAAHGVASGATTFDAAEALARVHPLLKHRVF